MKKNKKDATVLASSKARSVKIVLKRSIKYLKSNYAVNITGGFYFISQDTRSRHRLNQEKEEKQLNEIKSGGEIVTKKKSSKKTKWLNFSFFMINILIIAGVFWWQLSQDNLGLASFANIANVNWWFIIAALGLIVFGLILDQLRFSFLLFKGTGLLRPIVTFKLAIVGRHYDIITPLGSGGQPFEIFYLNKYGTKPGESISVAVGKYIFHQITYFIFITVILFSNLNVSNATSVFSGVLITMSWIGYVVIAIVIIGITLISLNKRMGAGLVIGILKLLHKMRIVKNYNASFRKVMKTVNDWQNTMKIYKNSAITWFFTMTVSAIYLVVWYSVPYFICCGFVGWNTEYWIQIITCGVLVDLASVYNPLPAGVGTSELSFSALFLTFFSDGIFWPMFIWKFVTYYFYMILGLGVITYDFAIGDRRLAKYKDKWLNPPYKERVQRLREARILRKRRRKARG